jgi:predicted nucleic acid-binding protein
MLSYKLPAVSSEELAEDAFQIAVGYDRTVCDSLYGALTVRFGINMVTADQKLANALGGLFPVKWLHYFQ